MLRRTLIPSCIVAFVLSACLAGVACGGEAVPDPATTVYGTRNAEAPAELELFAFLVGKWTGTMKVRGPDGQYTDYPLEWLGRYALNGMAISDEIRMAGPQGAGVQGFTLRYFDASTQHWTVEYFNFARSFLRKQVNAETGAVTQQGTSVTVTQSGPDGMPAREVYTLVDADHFTYSMDLSQDGGWNQGAVTMKLERQE